MNSVFDFMHHFQMRFLQNKNHKKGDKMFSILASGSNFWSLSRVMGVINEFGFRLSASFSDALTAK